MTGSLIMRATANPGAYSAPDQPTALLTIATMAALIGSGTLILGLLLGNDQHISGIVGLVIGGLLLVGGTPTALILSLAQQDARAHAAWDYADDVGDWLDDEHGIEAPTQQIDDLIAGETITAFYAGEETALTLKVAEGELRLVGAGLRSLRR